MRQACQEGVVCSTFHLWAGKQRIAAGAGPQSGRRSQVSRNLTTLTPWKWGLSFAQTVKNIRAKCLMCCSQPTFSVNHSCKRTFSLLSSRKSSGLTGTSLLCMMANFACLLEKWLCSQNLAHLLFSLINFVWLVCTFKPNYSTFVYSEHDAWRCSSGCTQLVMSQWVLCFWQLMRNTFRWHHSLGGGWTLIAAHKLTKVVPVSGVGFRQTPSRRGWTGWRNSTRLFWTFTRGIEP